jgi:hypothetical protein
VRRCRGLASALATAAAAALLTGCGAAAIPVAAAGPASAGPPTDATGLAGLLRASTATVHSVHLELSVAVGSVTVTAAGDEIVAQSSLQALDVTGFGPTRGDLRINITAGTTYLRLPPALNHTSKPWVLVSPTSKNPVVRQLQTVLQSVAQVAMVDPFRVLGSAARVTGHTQENLDDAPVTHYVLSVDVAKLPASAPGKQQLTAVGLTSLPLDLWVDQQGRLVQFTEAFDVKGQHVSTTAKFGPYNRPVTITPPPADEVSTG